MSSEDSIHHKDIIELTHVVKTSQPGTAGEGAPHKPLSTPDLTRFDETDNDLGKLSAGLARKVSSDRENPPGKTPGPATVSMDRIEAALERVVRKMYGKKIEAMVMDAVEKTVQREIEKINKIINEVSGKSQL
jgi:hypothetical protein